MELLNDKDDVEEDIILEQYDWETVEPALIHILLDNDKEAYELVSWIVWDAILDGKTINDDILIALLNLKLNTDKNPYDDNTVWSITSKAYGLSYDNSEYNPFRDLHLELKLNKYGLTFRSQEAVEKDACDGCPVIDDYSKPSLCPECGNNTVITTYEGVCIISDCKKCGWSVVGSGFYPNCSHDETKYTVRISREKYTNKQIIMLGKIFEKSTVKMAEECNSACDLEIAKPYHEALKVTEQCREAGIACCINPMPPYCQFGKCSYTAK